MIGRPAGRRLFFALWPPLDLAHALAETARLVQAQVGGRVMEEASLHITLAFLGQVTDERLPALLEMGKATTGSRFQVRLDLVRHWPHNEIVWLGASVVPPALPSLAQDLRAKLAEEDFVLEARPYTPHVTLLRHAKLRGELPDVAPLNWNAEDFVLVESSPAGTGPRYQILARWPLGTSG